MQERGGGTVRQDPIGGAVNNQLRDVDAGQVGAEVSQPRRHAIGERLGRGAVPDVPARAHHVVADQVAPEHVDVVEVRQERREERVPILRDGGPDPVEHTLVDAVRVVGRLQQERRQRGDEPDPAHALGAEGTDVVRRLAAPHRMAHQRDVAQVELRQERVQVLGEGVVRVARRWLARLAEPPTVVRDEPVARVEQDRELLLPGRPAQGPTVRQHDGPARAVVLIVELDGPRVLLSDSDERHLRLLAVAAESPPTARMT